MTKPVTRHRVARLRGARSEKDRRSPNTPAPTTRLRRVVCVGLLILATVGGIAAYTLWPRLTSPEVVVPRLLDKLNPELIDLINKQVAVVRAAPSDVNANATLAAIYEANRLWPEARICYRRVRGLDVNNPAWAYHEGIAAEWSGDVEAAVDLLRAAAARFPEFAPIQYRYGDALLERGDLVGAEAAFRKAVEYAPAEMAGYAALGDVLVRTRRYTEALVPLEHAVQLDPRFAASNYLLATAYRALGRMDEADRAMARATYKADRETKRYIEDSWSGELWKYARTVSLRIECSTDLIDLGRIDEALAILTPMLSTNPDNVKVLEKAGMAYLMKDRPDEAYRLLGRAQALDAENPRVELHLGIYYLKRHQLEDALRQFDRAVALDPDMWEAHHMRGVALLAQGLTEDAYEAFRRAVALRPTNPIVGRKLAEVCVTLGKWSEAKETLQSLIDYWPEYTPAHIALARVNIHLGAWSDASLCVDTARRLAPGDPALRSLQQAIAARKP